MSAHLCVYTAHVHLPCEDVCFVFQTACQQSRACPIQTGSALTVQSVETKPQGNIMEPPAVMAVKASLDAPYVRTTFTLAGTENKNILHEKTYINKYTAYLQERYQLLSICMCTLVIMGR